MERAIGNMTLDHAGEASTVSFRRQSSAPIGSTEEPTSTSASSAATQQGVRERDCGRPLPRRTSTTASGVIFPFRFPPCAKRREDIPLSRGHFLESFRKDHGKSPSRAISAEAHDSTGKSYDWPGNVREFKRTTMERGRGLGVRQRDISSRAT